MGYMTELGKQTYNLMESYGLGKYYDPYSGHIIINKEQMTSQILRRVCQFLYENENYVMGSQDCFFYVSPKEDL